jgi:hypothetical protein
LQSCRSIVKPKNHISCSWECRRVWGNEHTHSQAGVGVLMDSQIFKEWF